MKKERTRGDVLAEVYIQIAKDVYVEDYTAIEQLLASVSKKDLEEYLPEDENKEEEESELLWVEEHCPFDIEMAFVEKIKEKK